MSDTLVCEVVEWRDEPRESSGWHRIAVRALDDKRHNVTGCNLPRPGSRCELVGEWEQTKWGEQFHVRSITATKPPLSADGVKRWLEDRCEGIGPVKAAAIVRAFNGDPEALWASLARGHAELAAIVGAELAEHVHAAYEQDGTAREHYATLRGWRLTQAQINRILKHWRVDDACRRLYEDPYLLAEHISGFGFKRADEIANTVGIPKHSRMRIRAGILHCMSEAAQQGHVYGDVQMFEQMARTFLDVSMDETVSVLQELLAAKRLETPDGARIYLPVFARAEATAERATRTLLASDTGPTVEMYSLHAVEVAATQNPPVQLTGEQIAAIELVANMGRPVGFITGGPGTGKTTILQYAVKELEKQGVYVQLAAPTGKAARRLSEVTEREAMTLHRLLEFRPEHVVDCETCQRSASAFTRPDIKRCCIIVDEASMVDVQLWAELMRAIERGGNEACVRFVGDANQLPPVGPGQPFQDHLKALGTSSAVVRLTQVKRSGAGSWVANAAPQILAGQMPSIARQPDFRFFEVVRADHVPGLIETMLCGELDSDDWKASCLAADYVPQRRAPTGVAAPVLVPQKKGLAGVSVINKLLAEYYNPPPYSDVALENLIRIPLDDGTDLRVGARVMCTKNDYRRGVRNGDTGCIEHMEMHHDKRGLPKPEVFVRLDPDETTSRAIADARAAGEPIPPTPLVMYTYAEAREQLVLSYAMTIHKSQGSQYPWVVVVCHSTHTNMLTRRLIYTAITRASEGVVLIGNREGLARAVNNGQETARNTHLAQRLAAEVVS